MGRNGPNVEWVGLIVRTDDGQVHAVELDGYVGNFVTADLALDRDHRDVSGKFWISAVIRGRGRYWREGEGMGPVVSPRRQIGQRSEQLTLEGGEDGR
jgi:hypothetical protein